MYSLINVLTDIDVLIMLLLMQLTRIAYWTYLETKISQKEKVILTTGSNVFNLGTNPLLLLIYIYRDSYTFMAIP